MHNDRNDNSLIMFLNGMGILLLTLSLINVVKYRFDAKSSEDRIYRIEEARNEKLLEEALNDTNAS